MIASVANTLSAAATSRGLTTISLLPEIVYGCNSDRARSGATSRGLTTIYLQPQIVYGCNSNRARSGAKNY